jgi:hypothetical protein
MALKVPKIIAEVVNGSLKFDLKQKDILRRWLNNLNGFKVELVIKKYRKKRTIPQNSYYWGIVLDLISEASGYTTEELHELFKRLYLKKEIVIGGKVYEVSVSTKKLNTDQFEKYIEKIKRFAEIKLSLRIPNPNEIDYEEEFIIDEEVEDVKIEDIPKFFKL